MTTKQAYAKTDKPTSEPVIRRDGASLDTGVPFELIIPLWLGLASDEISLPNSFILLSDFGEEFDPSQAKTFTCHRPRLLAPPEAFFADSESDDYLSFPADIWTLACTVWDVFGSGPPFEVFVPTPDSMIREHVETFGKLPDRWWGKWADRNNWFDEDGRKNVKEDLRLLYSDSARSWDQQYPASIRDARWSVSRAKETNFEDFEEDEEMAFGKMVKSMLVFEPRQRATIEDVVKCEWMQEWGLPELQRMAEQAREEEARGPFGNS